MNSEKGWRGRLAVVTGGAGFVGSHIVEALAHAGARVRVVDSLDRGDDKNLARVQKQGDVQMIVQDIRDPKIWPEILKGADVVFHQAALRVNRCEEDPHACWDVMVDSTRSLFEACVAQRIKKVVFASSAIVYGAADQLPTPETHPLTHNTTWYGMAKIAGEQLLQVLTAHHPLTAVTLRYFNVYGSRMATKGSTEVLIRWFQALDAGESIKIFGDGSQTMDWVDVRDIARANLLATDYASPYGVFNIASGQETSLLNLARLVLKKWGKGGEPERVVSQKPINPIPRRWANISAAQSGLGFKSETSLEKGIDDMIHWWRDLAAVS